MAAIIAFDGLLRPSKMLVAITSQLTSESQRQEVNNYNTCLLEVADYSTGKLNNSFQDLFA